MYTAFTGAVVANRHPISLSYANTRARVLVQLIALVVCAVQLS